MAVRSRSAKRRADEQESDTRLSSRVEQAPDCEDHESALYSKSGGCVVTVHVSISVLTLIRTSFAVDDEAGALAAIAAAQAKIDQTGALVHQPFLHEIRAAYARNHASP